MPIESQIARIKAGMDSRISPWTQSDIQKMTYIRQVLESDMPQQMSKSYAAKEMFISFRAMDADKFRVVTNAVLDDAFRVAVPGSPAYLETVAMDMQGNQLALAYVSADADKSMFSFDLCVDADPDDATAGSWLNADEGVGLPLDSEILLDGYPTTYLSLRLKLEDAFPVRSVRVRLCLLGAADLLSLHGNIIADFAASRFFAMEERLAVRNGNDRDTIRNIRDLRDNLRKSAMGYLTPDRKSAGCDLGGAYAGCDVENKYWERFKGTRI